MQPAPWPPKGTSASYHAPPMAEVSTHAQADGSRTIEADMLRLSTFISALPLG